MRPLTLSLRNFRAHRSLDVDLTLPGCYSITGPNGRGKSSILIAIDFALFGERGEAAEYVNTDGDGSMSVELVFEHANDLYRVRRQVTRGKATLDLEIRGGPNEDEWASFSRETAKETQAFIEQTLGFSRATLRASSLLMQSDAGAFANATPRERKRILGEVLGLDRYDKLLDTVRADLADVKATEQRLAGRIEAIGSYDDLAALARTLSQDTAAAQARQNDLAQQLEAAEQAAADHAAEWERLRDQHARRRELDAEHRAATERASALRRIDTEAQAAREKADGMRTDIARLQTLADEHAGMTADLAALEHQERVRADLIRDRDQHHKEHVRLIEHCDDLAAQSAAVSAQIVALDEAENPVCEVCHQDLHDEARATARASYVKDRDEIDAHLLPLRVAAREAEQAAEAIVIPDEMTGVAELRTRIAELASAPAELAGARATLAGYEETIARADAPEHRDAVILANESEETLARMLHELPPVDAAAEATAQQAALTAQADATSLRQQATTARDTLLDLSRRLEDTRGKLDQLEEIADQATALSIRRGHLQHLERAYGPNGIRLLILENAAIPAIEHEANQVLAVLGGKPATEDWHVELRTQAEKKTGGLRDELDVVVHVPGGTRSYQNTSGGEQERVAIALRLGVARLLAQRRGADCQLLALDEPSHLDEEGKAALIDLLAERASDYELILLISHDSDLRDRFDHSIVVEPSAELAEVAA